MSKYVREIVKDIRENPDLWVRDRWNGIKKGDIRIYGCGNGSKWFFGWATSIVSLSICGKECYALTIGDRYALEEAVKWWMRNASLKMIQQ